MINKIKELKSKLGNKVAIPAHHYQIQEIVKIADFVGDSYKLAVLCSKIEAEFIVFCGVRFMAEGAVVLASADQKIFLPELSAGCPLADFITAQNMENALTEISDVISEQIVPVVYMNSSNDVKEVCGRNEGAVCTSSNAKKIVEYYFQKGKSVFFAPDYNLGINTAREMNIPESNIIKVHRDLTFRQTELPATPKLFIWDGNCRVHKRFQINDVTDFRQKYPQGKLIVHPECTEEIIKTSDLSGSTAKIYNEIKNSPGGSIWGVGTEYHFVQRLALEFPDKIIVPLRKSVCSNMAKISLKNLYETLKSINDHLENGTQLRNLVTVTETHKVNSRKALQKMIKIVEG
ncbi:MAG: quinolinate synthase NadA [Candidatus Cloacimonetes bacterium]|nr:quinolinate synthase NadA [Candidatus Cloacimonadota bacterium]